MGDDLQDVRRRERRQLSPLGESAIRLPFRGWFHVVDPYGESGTGMRRRYIHDEHEAAIYGAKPGTFTEWEEIAPDSDLLFYEGLHGGLVTDDINIAEQIFPLALPLFK